MARTANTTEKPDLREYLAPVWRFKWIILALATTVALTTYFYYGSKPKIYQSSTTIYVGTSQVSELVTGTQQVSSERDLANQARALQSRAVAVRAAELIGYSGNPEKLLGALQVAADPQADFLTLVAAWPDPEGAARLANAFAQAFREQRVAAQRGDVDQALTAARQAMANLGPRSPSTRDEEQKLAATISQLEILGSLPAGEATQLNRALPPSGPTSPHPAGNAIFAFVLSLAFGVFAAYGIDRLNRRRIREPDEVSTVYEAPLLGTIPRAAERLSYTASPAIPGPLFESFRTLRTSLEIAGAAQGTLLITSGMPGEGKSTVALNLAMAYRDAGKQVAIVEADLRQPTAALSLSTPAEPGLTDVLSGDVTLAEALHEVPRASGGSGRSPMIVMQGNGSGPDDHRKATGRRKAAAGEKNGSKPFKVESGSDLGGMWLLPGGSSPTPDPPTLLATSELKKLLLTLSRRFDIVLIDTPPLLSVSDALPLLAKVDGTLLVSRVGTTTQESAEHVAELVMRVPGARVLGVVANDVPPASLRARYASLEYEPTS
jgi:Mrp family chromosome partitioning ATPase